jgi:hypothetical protein
MVKRRDVETRAREGSEIKYSRAIERTETERVTHQLLEREHNRAQIRAAGSIQTTGKY